MSQLNSTFVDGQMSLETLWRLLEEQRRQNGSSVASVVGLDEAKILVENQRDRHGMTTLGKTISRLYTNMGQIDCMYSSFRR